MKLSKFVFVAFVGALLAISCTEAKKELPASEVAVNLPPGFSIQVYADSVTNARQMTRSDSGVLFVSTRRAGNVYALYDDNNDFRIDRLDTIATGLYMPNGVAFRDGALYVAEVNRILRFDNIEEALKNSDTRPEYTVVYDQYPTERHHGWKYIAFGPDGKLYVPVGAPCNICNKEEENPIFATITRMNPDGSDLEIYAKGVRNSVGFTWHPETDEMWFTDNGRDMMGNDIPPCELNRVTEMGQHFGYPFRHGRTIPDPEFGTMAEGKTLVPPAQELGPHVAPLGLIFYTGSMFPESYKNQVLVAEHGSWNRDQKIGYRLSLVNVDENSEATNYSTFADGWLHDEEQSNWGRPVDILQMPDGSILVSDDFGGKIYRIIYTG